MKDVKKNVKLYLNGEIECRDCYCVSEVKVRVETDSRDTVIVEGYDITLPDGWVNVVHDYYWEGDDGYRCNICEDARAEKRAKREAKKLAKTAEKSGKKAGKATKKAGKKSDKTCL